MVCVAMVCGDGVWRWGVAMVCGDGVVVCSSSSSLIKYTQYSSIMKMKIGNLMLKFVTIYADRWCPPSIRLPRLVRLARHSMCWTMMRTSTSALIIYFLYIIDVL